MIWQVFLSLSHTKQAGSQTLTRASGTATLKKTLTLTLMKIFLNWTNRKKIQMICELCSFFGLPQPQEYVLIISLWIICIVLLPKWIYLFKYSFWYKSNNENENAHLKIERLCIWHILELTFLQISFCTGISQLIK